MCDCHGKDENGNTWSYKDRLQWPSLYQKYFSVMKTPINVDSSCVQNVIGNGLTMFWSNHQLVKSVENINYIQYDCLNQDSYVHYQDKKFVLLQWHYHASAENTVDNLYYPMEVHFVHGYENPNTNTTEILVVALHIKVAENPSQESVLCKNLINNFGKEVAFDLSSYNQLPKFHLYRWIGSLTIPPFTNSLLFNLWSPQDLQDEYIKTGIQGDELILFNKFFSDSRDLITNEYAKNRCAKPLEENFLRVQSVTPQITINDELGVSSCLTKK